MNRVLGAEAQADLDVIVAARDARQSLAECLAALDRQARDTAVSVRVVGGIEPSIRSELSARYPRVSFDDAPPDALVPELWGRGIERSRAPWVALTIGQCVPDRNWLDTIAECIRSRPDAAGFGGPIEPPDGSRGRDAAAFLARYSAYMEMAAGEVDDLPGDNAVYRRNALDAAWSDRGNGFWEVLVNDAMRRRGELLLFVPTMVVRLGALESAAAFWRLRYRHGRHYGATRELSSSFERWARAVSAPLLIPWLAWRFWHRIPVEARARIASPIRVVPWLTAFLVAWVAGEASGYLRPRESS